MTFADCHLQTAICRLPGVEAILMGPFDLADSLGHRGNAGLPDVQAASAQALKTADAAEKAAGVLVLDGKAEAYFAGGACFVGVGRDLHLLIAGTDAATAKFKL